MDRPVRNARRQKVVRMRGSPGRGLAFVATVGLLGVLAAAGVPVAVGQSTAAPAVKPVEPPNSASTVVRGINDQGRMVGFYLDKAKRPTATSSPTANSPRSR